MNRKIKMMIVVLAVVLAVFVSRSTLAFDSTVGKATNVVTSGNIQLAIHEHTADGEVFPEEGVYVIPGDVVSKRVTIENICSQPFYLRVKLVTGVAGESTPADALLRMDLNTEYWVQHEDGYLYYTEILKPGQTTESVFTHVEIVGDHVDQTHLGKTLTLSVTAQAVQSKNNPADDPWDASGWPAE